MKLMTLILSLCAANLVSAQLVWPPEGQVLGASSPALLVPTGILLEGVKIAKTSPQVDLLYYDCQTYAAKPGVWSAWGDGLAVGDLYYSAIGDHSSPGGNAFVYAYDSNTQELKKLTDLRGALKQPDGHYTPGKIHSELGLGADGWLYFSTHRGSTKIAFHETARFKGDWLMRHHPEEGKTEIVAHAPLPMQCLPCGTLDPERLIFYSGTADGKNEKAPQFLAYDLKARKVLYSDERGPARAMIRARNGMIYFHAEKSGSAPLLRFDPDKPKKGLTPIAASVGLRAASAETSEGKVYTVDRDELWEFDTESETARSLGATAVGSQTYITSLDHDPATGRYLYYIPGSHGGAQADGSPLVQYDLKTKKRKVIAFLHPFFEKKIGYIPMGAYSVAGSPAGDKVYTTWNGNRKDSESKGGKGGKVRFNTCALTVVHIPESERPD